MNLNTENVHYRIAQTADVEAVYDFEFKLKLSAIPDEYERQMAVWSSAFRKEALEHYFNLGWSFIALNQKNEIQGFFLGQALLFFDHQTQTLWLEYLSGINSEIETELVDIAYRLAREKHLQRVLLSETIQKMNLKKSFPFQKWERSVQFLKTTK